jgi:hypothetical protein
MSEVTQKLTAARMSNRRTQSNASFRFTFPVALALANDGRLGGSWYSYYDTR